MKYCVYSVLDSVSSMYSLPFFSLNHLDAVRSIADFANSHPGSIPHPDDQVLVYLGDFDSSTGALIPCPDVSDNVISFTSIFERYGINV